jgi:hypothetical protein
MQAEQIARCPGPRSPCEARGTYEAPPSSMCRTCPNSSQCASASISGAVRATFDLWAAIS